MAEALCVGFGGVAGEDFCDDFHGGQLFKYPDEVFPWIDAAAALDEVKKSVAHIIPPGWATLVTEGDNRCLTTSIPYCKSLN